jgi:hypothetical protein
MSTRLQQQFRATLVGGLMASLFYAHALYGAIPEVEPNNTKAQAQVLVVPTGGVTVSAMLGVAPGALTTDFDWYAFDGQAGDVPTIMVVSDATWDSFLGLYDWLGNLLVVNDDAYPMNPGSKSPLDSRIDTYRLAATGRYYIAVTASARSPLLANYALANSSISAAGGAYSLIVSGVTAVATPAPPPAPVGSSVRVVTIEVMEGSKDDADDGHHEGNDEQGNHEGNDEQGNHRDLKPISVAIMSSPHFDALTIDQKSLKFGATGSERSLLRCRSKGKDVNHDGLKDLVCDFDPVIAGFKVGDVQGFLKGTTVKGEGIEGSAALRTVLISTEKTESWHERHHIDPRGETYRRHQRSESD